MDDYKDNEKAPQVVQVVQSEPPQAVKANPRYAKLAAEKARQEAENTRRWAMDNIESYGRSIQRESEKMKSADKEAQKKVREWAEAFSLLSAAGLKPVDQSYPRWTIGVLVTEKRLPALARVIGRLDVENAEKQVECAEKLTIRITAKCIKYPCVRVSWVKKLTADDKCKIQEQITPAKVTHKLVCNVGD